MSTMTMARAGARLAYNHPQLVKWYLFNKLRVAGLMRQHSASAGTSAHPIGITLKPTFCCNLRCSMCSFVANGAVNTNPQLSLPLSVWTRLIDDVRAWRPYIWFTGGEPTLYPHFIPLLRHIKRQGLICGMTTNGTTLTKLCDQILDTPMDLVVVSIDGPEHVHNQVRGNDTAFQRATEGIVRLQQGKRQRGIKDPAVVINCALTPSNFEHAAQMVGIAEQLGAVALNYQHLWQLTSSMVSSHNARWGGEHPVSYEGSGGMEPSPMDPNRVAEVVREVKALKPPFPVLFHPEIDESEIHTYYTQPDRFVQRKPAACAWLNTDILPNGDVSPCFEMVTGNITQKPFTEIWNGEPFRAHRQRLQTEGDFTICARCCAYWRRD